MTSNSDSPRPAPMWRFWVPLFFQTVLILAIPAQALYIHLTGKRVLLQIVPVDPYGLLQDYSQTLRYDISIQDNLRKLPGWKELPKQPTTRKAPTFIKPGTRFYVILEAPKTPTPSTELPQAWKPVAVSGQRPSQLNANRVALKGLAQNGLVQYGLETSYLSISEEKREQINADLRAMRPEEPTQLQELLPSAEPTQKRSQPPIIMEIKVNDRGEAVPVSLWVQVDKGSKQQVHQYRF
ncbi:MAG TPA: GDYXXLXY domain-containing protein [Coleofasciculaceae cyanobacterium]